MKIIEIPNNFHNFFIGYSWALVGHLHLSLTSFPTISSKPGFLNQPSLGTERERGRWHQKPLRSKAYVFNWDKRLERLEICWSKPFRNGCFVENLTVEETSCGIFPGVCWTTQDMTMTTMTSKPNCCTYGTNKYWMIHSISNKRWKHKTRNIV